VAGWASDEQSPDLPQLLEILEDGAPVASILADRYRPIWSRRGSAPAVTASAWRSRHRTAPFAA
jgi:hypothetical protein